MSDALDRFEALVLSQKPATEPWRPTAHTPYDFESRKAAEGKHPDLIVEVFQPQRVLDAGCGPGHLMTMLEERGVDVFGIDSHVDYSARSDIQQADIAGDLRYRGWEQQWDLVVARELYEHLTILQIRRAVMNCCMLSSRWVYGTTRYTTGSDLLSVDTSDQLDPTHISMLSKDFLHLLFALEGFKRRRDLEKRIDWRGLGRTFCFERVHHG